MYLKSLHNKRINVTINQISSPETHLTESKW